MAKMGHSIESMKVTILEVVKEGSLFDREEVWIERLKSRLPKGLIYIFTNTTLDEAQPTDEYSWTHPLECQPNVIIPFNAHTHYIVMSLHFFVQSFT